MNQHYSRLSPARQALLERWKVKTLSCRQTIPKRLNQTAVPLSCPQQQLWFIDQYYSGSPFYNIPVPLHLKGSLNLVALRRSFNQMVRRHESWRTVSAQIGDQLLQ